MLFVCTQCIKELPKYLLKLTTKFTLKKLLSFLKVKKNSGNPATQFCNFFFKGHI